MDAHKEDWVTIHHVVMKPDQRSEQIPPETRQVPLEMWVKGFVQSDADIGQQVTVHTITGRQVSGRLVEVNPCYRHDYGRCVPELLKIGLQVKEILQKGSHHE